MNTTSVEVTAGLGGFLVVFALALAVWFLGRDLTRRLRRMKRAEEVRLERDRVEQVRVEQPGKDQPGEDQPEG
jgi:hypothetical protein